MKRYPLTQIRSVFITTLLSTLIVGCNNPQGQTDEAIIGKTSMSPSEQLVSEFKAPPSESKPLTWFHSMSGNMSAAGLTKDLEAIAQAGIGGTILFNVTQGIPLGDVRFNSKKHIKLIGHMASESKRLGLSFGIHNCDGWTSSGGPWITPEHSMKLVTFSETIVSGGQVNIQLPRPYAKLDYYEDIATLAYPALATEIDDKLRSPVVSASDPDFDIKIATDEDQIKYSTISSKDESPVWLQLEYKQPYTLRLINMLFHEGRGVQATLEVSDDGKVFTVAQKLNLRRPDKRTWGFDESFEGITAKYFRIVSNKALNVKEVKFSSTPAMYNYLGRTSASPNYVKYLKNIGKAPKDFTIQSANIINLTESVDSDGVLTTTLPEGQWTVMRFGYTTTGATNLPASREGKGLEVDKFSRASFKIHYDNYVTNVINQVKKVAPDAMQYVEIDSFEVGGQNWTKGYQDQFKQRFGYDLIPFLPLYSGKFVDSAEVSEQVLWDTRDFNNQLITKNYYNYFTELVNKDGMVSYIEPYGLAVMNELDVGKQADIPMGEFWLDRNRFRVQSSVSSAHLYDKNIISAESFTQMPGKNWLFSPAYGKHDGDKAWALGINQHVFHRFAHQSNTHVMPGMTMNRWGAHFDRTQPWWSTGGKAWFEYMSRGQHLLRVGRDVSDLLWYLGDAVPSICPEQDNLIGTIPTYLNYDCLNSDSLYKLTVKDGKLTLPQGSQYKIIALTNHHRLSYKSLEKLYKLSQQGAVIIGDRVQNITGKDVSAQQRKTFFKMVDFIWSQPTTYDYAVRKKGSEKIDWSRIYSDRGWRFDLKVKNLETFFFTHRRSPTHDIYFVYNDTKEAYVFDATFNVAGKMPELWDINTKEIKKLAAFSSDGKTTRVPFKLDKNESAFVVFSKSSEGFEPVDPDTLIKQGVEALLDDNDNIVFVKPIHKSKSIDGPWRVAFNDFYGLDKTYVFDELTDWKNHSDPEIRNYSGTALYQKTFELSPELLSQGDKLLLDLGAVSVSAEVTLNGVLVGTAWVEPYQLDISKFLMPGENTLEIKVANLWHNRLLADSKLPDTSGLTIARWTDPVVKMPQWYVDNQPAPKSKRFTFTPQEFFKGDESRISSGLIGPVNIRLQKVDVIK